MNNLADRTCKPCEGGVEPLGPDAARELIRALHEDWHLAADGRSIGRHFSFPAWGRTVSYNTCDVSYTTNAIGGLSDNDFICAAKIDRLVAGT